MDHALARLAGHPALSSAERRYLTTAQATTGSRYVFGKAKVLLLVYRNHQDARGQVFADDPRAADALARARQIWPDLA